MKNNTILDKDLQYIDEDVFSIIRNYTIHQDDLYLTIAGTIGTVGEVPTRFDGMNLTENAAKLTNIKCNKKYLMYALLSSIAQDHFKSKFHQVAQPKLSIETASTTFVALPPINEQERIVEEVEDIFSQINKLDDCKTDLQEYIKQTKSKILSLAIAGKLVPQDPNDEPAINLLRRINPTFKPCDTSYYENIPNQWIIANLLDLCKIDTGKWDANHASKKGKYRFYTCAAQHALSDTKRFAGECLIVPGNGDIGAVYYYDGEFDAYQRTYVLHDIKVNPKYLYYHFLSNWRTINSDKKFGSTIKFVRIGNFQNYYVALPPLEEQKRIVDCLEDIISQLDNISAEL